MDLEKCIGCRACEIACSAFHAVPKYSVIRPATSRIRLVADPLNNEYVPVRSTDYAKAECDGRRVYVISKKEYSECIFCGTICPARDLFKEPGSGLPLICDLCKEDQELEEPLCVQACQVGALTYQEKEEEPEQEEKRDEVEMGLKYLLDKHGFKKMADTFIRLANK